MKKFLILVFLILLIVTKINGQGIQFTASVDKKVLSLGQTLTLTFQIIVGGANISGSPEMPELDGFTVASGPNVSTSISIVNGQVSASRSYSYILIPTKVGKLTIGSAVLNYNGEVYKTTPIEVEIVKSAVPHLQTPQTPQTKVPQDESSDLSNQVFLKVFVDKKNPYQNEGVTVSYKLYTRVQVRSYGISKPPTATGAWIEEYAMPQQPVLSTEVIEGISYQSAVIKKLELFPAKSGELTLEPLVIQADVIVRGRTPRSFFDFDSFFDDDFFGRTERKNLIAPAVKLNVLPLPEEGKPVGFKNVVGKFSLTSETDRTDILTNEAVSLRIKISGTGNIKLIESPGIKISGDFEMYEPKVEEMINRSGENISGEKGFEYVLVPRIPGVQKIEPITFSYFNPETKRYTTLTTEEIFVNVAPGKERLSAYPGNLSRDEVKLVGSDIRFIKLKPIQWNKEGDRFYKDYVFLTLIIFPLILLGITIIYNNHLERISTDISYRRGRMAVKTAEKRLKESDVYMKEESREKFYLTLSSALRGYIADKLNISEVGFLTDDVKEMLENKKVDVEITNKFLELINTCDYLRFSPTEANLQDMRKTYQESKEIIILFEKHLLSLRRR